MEAYKFETTVLDNGVIQIPEISQLAHHSVEVFIVVKQPAVQSDNKTSQSIEMFLEKWTGFMKSNHPDDNKLDYLRGKYS